MIALRLPTWPPPEQALTAAAERPRISTESRTGAASNTDLLRAGFVHPQPETPMKVIFDTDPGIDDAIALFYLSRLPQLELLGITTVVGNADVDATTRNALFLRQRFGLAAPVIRGAARALDGVAPSYPTRIHGHNGLGDIPLPDSETAGLRPGSASQFIIDTLRAHPGDVTLIAVGCLTNLALALRQAPDIAGLAKAIVIMGGAFGYQGRHGNVTPVAEANIHGDPLAADDVFAADWPVVVVGLDVTYDVVLSADYLAALARDAGENGKLIQDISAMYLRFYQETRGIDGVVGHDLLPVAYLVRPELFATRSGPLCVVREGIARGQTIQMPDTQRQPLAPWRDRRSQLICTGVDGDAVLAHYWDSVTAR